MPEDSLHFQQVDACFDQAGGIGMAQAVWRNSFFKPQSRVTWRKVVWMPPRSSGVVARWAFLSPHFRLGKSNAGLRWVCQKRRNICKVFSGNGTKRSRLPLALRTCTRIRSASMSPACKRNPSPSRNPRLYRVKKNTRYTPHPRGHEYLLGLWHGNNIRQCV